MAHFTPVATHHTMVELKIAIKRSRDEGQKTRLRAIMAAQAGSARKDIAAMLSVSDHSITNWVHAYNKGGTDALITNKGGRPKGSTVWKDDMFTDLAKAIDTGGYWSIPRMQEWLKEHKDTYIPEQTVWYRMDQLKYSYKSARPHPMQGNKEKQETFKKGGWFRSSRH
jgi:transposase